MKKSDPAAFQFETTKDLEEFHGALGQERALAAIRLAVGVEDNGFNLYVMGPPGMGKHSFVQEFLEKRAREMPKPPDLCYVHSFALPQNPKILQLPAGAGVRFRDEIEEAVESLRVALQAAFESDEYRASRSAIEDGIKERHDRAFKELQEQGEAQGVRLIRTSEGLVFAPTRDGKVVAPEDFRNLSPEEQQNLKRAADSFHARLHGFLSTVPEWEKEGREKLKALGRTTAARVVEKVMVPVKENWGKYPDPAVYLEAFVADVLENVSDFLKPVESPLALAIGGGDLRSQGGPSGLRRYEVNLFVDHSQLVGAPVVYEDNPTYQNLLGRVEHFSHFGTLATDFTLIKAGALQRANGGFLVLDALKLFTQPFSWDALKRSLKSREIRIESVGQFLSLVSTISLEPEPLKVTVKLVLIGDRAIFDLVSRLDPDFDELFKVGADFEDRLERKPENEQIFARLVGTLARGASVRALDRAAVAKVIEERVRESGNAGFISVRMSSLVELLREADFFAAAGARTTITVSDVECALDQRIFRKSRLRDRICREMSEGTIQVAVTGREVGRINGLSVAEWGGFRFGFPVVITARARMGKGELLDIERQVKLGGPIHSKGVLILGGYLGGRYLIDWPLSVSATLVFEQSYGAIEGDSASAAELYALLSAIAGVPLLQSFGMTGSISQQGNVQAVGAINEKIEGYFETCSHLGLSGSQGVVIPESNVGHLMLRREVREAVQAGRFQIYSIRTVDEGIELLTGMPAVDFHARVENRLAQWAAEARQQTLSQEGRRRMA